jgi:monovalent cation:H+ antiporter-2, CPA2 family
MEGAEEFALVRDFAIIMAVAGGVVVLFRKLNQPPILGYLIAGLLIGPFTFPCPPITNRESIRLLADLGLVLLLFAVGLEFGWRRIRQVGLGVLFIGGLEMLIMISLGYWVGRLLGWMVQESIFLGAALSISSSAILVKVLQDMGRLASLSGRLIIGTLVVEDFAAVLLRTLLSEIATTGTAGWGDVGLLVAKLAVFAVASLALGALFVPWIIRFVSQFRSRETLLLASRPCASRWPCWVRVWGFPPPPALSSSAQLSGIPTSPARLLELSSRFGICLPPCSLCPSGCSLTSACSKTTYCRRSLSLEYL